MRSTAPLIDCSIQSKRTPDLLNANQVVGIMSVDRLAAAANSQPVGPTRDVKDALKLKGVKPRRSVSAVRTLLEERQRR